MPNQPSEQTVTVSFTLPRELDAAMKQRARSELTNKSDIIRRALLAYLPEDVREQVLNSLHDAPGTVHEQVAQKVNYMDEIKKKRS